MPLTPQGYHTEVLQSLAEAQPYTPPDPSFLERAGILGAEAIPRAINNLSESAGNLLDLPQQNRGGFLPETDTALPQASTIPTQFENFLGGGLLPAALELYATGKFIPRIPGAGVASQVSNAVTHNALEFGLLGSQDNNGVALEQAGEGAALGTLRAFPLKYRAPLALALGYGSKAFFDSQNPTPIGQIAGHDITQGDISGVLQTAFGIFGGQAQAPKIPAKPILNVPGEFHGPFQQQLLEGPVRDPSVQTARQVGDPGTFGDSGQIFGQPSAPTPAATPTLPPDLEGEFTRLPLDPDQPQLTHGEFSPNAPQAPITDFQAPQTPEQLAARVPVDERSRRFPFGYQPSVVPLEGPIRPIGNLPSQSDLPTLVRSMFQPEEAKYLRDKLNVDIGQPEAQTAFMQLAVALTTKEVRESRRAQSIAFAKFFADLHNRPDLPASTPQTFEETVSKGLQSLQSGLPELGQRTESITGRKFSDEFPPAWAENDPAREATQPKASPPLQGLPEGGAEPIVAQPTSDIQSQLTQVRARLQNELNAQRVGASTEDSTFEIESLKRVERVLADRAAQEASAIPASDTDAAVQSAAQVDRARSKGKTPDLPEYRRTEGGSTNLDTLLSTLGIYGRGLGGFAAGHYIASHDNNDHTDPIITGAIIAGMAMGAPYTRRLIEALRTFGNRVTDEARIPQFNAGRGEPKFRSSVEVGKPFQSDVSILPELSKGGTTVRPGDYDPAMGNYHARALPELQAAQADKEAALQRLQNESQSKGKVRDRPSYLSSEGGTFLSPGGSKRPGDVPFINPYDGTPRIEINDNVNTRWLENGSRKLFQVPLEKVLVHPELYDRIPELKNVQVGVLLKEGKPSSAKFISSDDLGEPNGMGRIMLVNPKNPHDFQVKVIHELQHAIQDFQGLPGGTSEKETGTFRSYNQAPGEIEAHTADRLYTARDRAANPDGSQQFGGIQSTDNPVDALKKQGGYWGAKGSNQAGALIPELAAPLLRGTAGGLLGGAIGAQTDDPGDHTGFMTGAFIGAGAGIFGPSIARKVAELLGEKKIPQAGPEGGKLKRDWETKLEEKGGTTFNGSQLVSDRLFRALDKGFGLTTPEVLKEVLSQAKGAGSWLLDQIDNAILTMDMRFKPSEEVKTLTNQFFDGEITRDSYLQSMQNHIALDPNNEAYQNFAVTARTSVTGLQKMIAGGIQDPKLRSVIQSSFDKYLTRSYRVFNEARWTPSEDSFAKLAKEIHEGKFFGEGNSYEDVQGALRQYIRELKATKGSYAPVNPEGIKISQQALKERKQLSDAWREFLGEVKDSTQRIYQTVFRLRPMAEAARYFENVAKIEYRGMPQAFDSAADRDLFRTKLAEKLKLDPTNSDLQYQDAALKSYQYVEQQNQYGSLGGKIVSRSVWDTLKTYDSMTEITNPYLRGIAQTHTMIKLSRTALNPISVIRNAVTAPVFAAIGRASIPDMVEGYKISTDASHPLRQEILEMGIGNVDQVKTEFYKEFDNLTGSKFNFGTIDGSKLGMGNIDLDLAERYARRGFRKVLDFYRAPDNITRIGTYLSAKRRIAESLGLELSDQRVKDKAAIFTNRYTMNYDSIAPAIKTARQIPLVNLFLSYTAEVARIGKNLMEDVITGKGDGLTQHGRMFAMIPLIGIALVPEMMQQSAEDELSPKDKADWEKAKLLMPDYARTRYRFNIKRDPKTKQFTYTDFTPLVPTDAYNQMFKAIAHGDWQALGAVNPIAGTQNTPFVNIAVSQLQGKDLQTQRPFRDFSDRFASIAKEVLPPNTPGVGSEAVRFNQAYTPNAEGTLGTTNLRTGTSLTPADFWQVYYSGLKPGGVNLSVLQQKLQSQAKQDVANEIAYANDILKSNAAPEIKQKALDRTKAALVSIRDRYAEQLGVKPSQTSSTNNATASLNQ